MKIKYSALVMGVSGKLNGSVGATNKGGAYLRNKGVVSNPNTAAQSAVRQNFGSLSSAFRGLGAENIAAWNAAAANFPIIDRLGDTRFVSGLALFVQLNTNLGTIGVAPLTAPPAKQPFPILALTAFVINFPLGGGLGAVSVTTVTDRLTDGDFKIIYKFTPGVSAGISNAKNQLRLVSTATVVPETPQVVDLVTPYVAKFGSAPVGSVVGVEVSLISTISGEASAVLYSTAVVTETP